MNDSMKEFEELGYQEIDTSPREEIIELFFSLSPQTLSELQSHCANNGITAQNAVEEAVKIWIADQKELGAIGN